MNQIGVGGCARSLLALNRHREETSMSAITILPHHFAASILFVYALLAFCFSARRPPQSVKLTHMDVELAFCTTEELEYMLALLLNSSARLTEREISRFWDVCAELENRRTLNG